MIIFKKKNNYAPDTLKTFLSKDTHNFSQVISHT